MTTRRKIGVLAGGSSSEREVSLRSGQAVYEALQESGFDAVFIDVMDHISAEEAVSRSKLNAVFIVLHGGFGEDGTMQRILRGLNVPYTGSGPEASRLALDKLESRKLFVKAGLDVPDYRVVNKGETLLSEGLRMPIVVKPRCEGSSIGLSVVCESHLLEDAVSAAFQYGDSVLLEEFIRGRELTVGILQERPLPVIEIVSESGCYDYSAKYKSPNTQYLVPAPINSEETAKAQAAALLAHNVLGCRSLSRVDMILGEGGRIYVLEVNTIPGLTSRSLLPKAAMAAGIDFRDLCVKILESASV